MKKYEIIRRICTIYVEYYYIGIEGGLKLFYSDEIIEEIKNKNDILDIVSQYVTLKRSGRNYMGVCPFHKENTPSFSVSPDRQIFHCFGCGVGGNAITFISKIENLSFKETIEFMAERSGIVLPTYNSKEDNEKQFLRKRIYEINELAARYFHENLYKPTSKLAQNYVKSRKMDNKTLKMFLIGYSGTYNELYTFLRKKGYNDNEIYAANLATRTDDGKYIDRFRKRLMIPIMDTRNRVIAFGGRIIEDRKDTAKYINTNENPVYSKGRNLFALNLAKKSDNKKIIIVEGYMDAISLYQRGLDNVVASLGTALTEAQGRLLRSKEQVIIAYDSDGAGQTATLRGLEILQNLGIDVRVLQMEGAKDPDEYIIKFGSAGFNKLVENAISLIEFKIKVLQKDLDLTNVTDKIKFLNQIAKVLSTVDNNMEKEVYVEKISEVYKISKEAIYAEVNKLKYGNENNKKILEMPKINAKIHISKSENISIDEKKENLIIKLLITAQYKVYKKIKDIIKPEYFKNEVNRKIVEKLYDKYNETNRDIEDILLLFDEEIILNKISLIMFENNEKLDIDKCIQDVIKTFNQDKLMLQRNEIIERLKNPNLNKEESEKLENDLSIILIKIAQSK